MNLKVNDIYLFIFYKYKSKENNHNGVEENNAKLDR